MFHFVIKEAAREVFSVCFISSHIRHSIMLPILLACILEDCPVISYLDFNKFDCHFFFLASKFGFPFLDS